MKTLMRIQMPSAFLALILIVGLAPATDSREEAAIRHVEKLGGKVVRDKKNPGGSVTDVSLANTQCADRDLPEVVRIKTVQTLDLMDTKVTDAGLAALAELKQLKQLFLTGDLVTDGGTKDTSRSTRPGF